MHSSRNQSYRPDLCDSQRDERVDCSHTLEVETLEASRHCSSREDVKVDDSKAAVSVSATKGEETLLSTTERSIFQGTMRVCGTGANPGGERRKTGVETLQRTRLTCQKLNTLDPSALR